MTHLSAYTGPSPATGYVGYVNFTLTVEGVRITVRPESERGDQTVALTIPFEAARALFSDALDELAKHGGVK